MTGAEREALERYFVRMAQMPRVTSDAEGRRQFVKDQLARMQAKERACEGRDPAGWPLRDGPEGA